MSTLEEALRIARLGHKVFPLIAKNQPATAHGFKDATTDEAQITRWWSKQDYLVGMNPEANEVVIDLDYHKNGNLSDQLVARGFVFPGNKGGQVTPSGGAHLPFRTDGRPLTIGSDLEDIIGLDIRPSNGYVVVYQPEAWTASSAWAEAPEWVYALKKHAADHAPLLPTPDEEDDEPAFYYPDAVTGRACRYPTLAKDMPLTTDSEIISWLGAVIASGRPSYSDPEGHEYSVPELVRVQKEAHEAGLIVATAEPWTGADWKRHAESLWDKEHEPRDWWGPRGVMTYETARAFAVKMCRFSKAIFARRPQPDAPFMNIVDYLADVPDHVPWLAEPLTYFGGVTLLAGIWKGGKSTLAVQLMRARETGETFFGSHIPIGPTVLITEEGGIPVMFKTQGMRDLLILDRRMAALKDMSFEDTCNAIKAFCEKRDQPALVVIDTLAVWGEIEDENEAGEITRRISDLAVLAQHTGAAMILVDHVRKEGGTHGRGIRGSGAKGATADIFGVLDYPANGGEKTDRTLTLEGRVIEPIDLRLTYDKDTKHYSVMDKDEADLEEIESLLEGIPSDGPGVPSAALMQAWGLKTRPAVTKRAEWLLNKGRMRRVEGKVGNATGYLYWSIPPAMG